MRMVLIETCTYRSWPQRFATTVMYCSCHPTLIIVSFFVALKVNTQSSSGNAKAQNLRHSWITGGEHCRAPVNAIQSQSGTAVSYLYFSRGTKDAHASALQTFAHSLLLPWAQLTT
mmetsp:Transcript_7044/g.13072  ORF Transcript_7044/g.13072 Transcript_7044/m.13072 type:complete len:116 (+) Transcript_7044:920-1267(+)